MKTGSGKKAEELRLRTQRSLVKKSKNKGV